MNRQQIMFIGAYKGTLIGILNAMEDKEKQDSLILGTGSFANLMSKSVIGLHGNQKEFAEELNAIYLAAEIIQLDRNLPTTYDRWELKQLRVKLKIAGFG